MSIIHIVTSSMKLNTLFLVRVLFKNWKKKKKKKKKKKYIENLGVTEYINE